MILLVGRWSRLLRSLFWISLRKIQLLWNGWKQAFSKWVAPSHSTSRASRQSTSRSRAWLWKVKVGRQSDSQLFANRSHLPSIHLAPKRTKALVHPMIDEIATIKTESRPKTRTASSSWSCNWTPSSCNKISTSERQTGEFHRTSRRCLNRVLFKIELAWLTKTLWSVNDNLLMNVTKTISWVSMKMNLSSQVRPVVTEKWISHPHASPTARIASLRALIVENSPTRSYSVKIWRRTSCRARPGHREVTLIRSFRHRLRNPQSTQHRHPTRHAARMSMSVHFN